MKYKKFATKIRPYIMTAPALAGILLFTIYPIIKLIQLSLMNTNMPVSYTHLTLPTT